MLLAVDVGNTNTSLGLFDGYKLKYQWRISTDRDRTFDETGMLFRSLFQSVGENMQSIKDAIICSVVPPVGAKKPKNRVFQFLPMACFDNRPSTLKA